jgi:hypothetical protein
MWETKPKNESRFKRSEGLFSFRFVSTGPFNSWDRAPYITTIGLHAPRPSVFPKFRNIHHNFMLANYNSQEAIDNDDGSRRAKDALAAVALAVLLS